MSSSLPTGLSRRQCVAAGLCLSVVGLAPRTAWPDSDAWLKAVQTLTGGRPVQDGRVRLELSPLVENGNAVPVTLSVESPMTAAEHVRRLAVMTERNPQPEVAVFHLSPLSGRARVSTRMRLATSQKVWALAELSDGSWWRHGVDVVVTLAACVEGEVV
jgi:sulfur-oxidizing protein SoxY